MENDFRDFILEFPKFEIDKDDNCVLNFYYPNVYQPVPAGLLQCIRLEMGAIAYLTPNEIRDVKPLISKIKSPIIKYTTFKVKTISPIKTFWEKVMILHQEANRPLIKPGTNNDYYKTPLRYSRHYYDVWKLFNSEYISNLKNQSDYLKKVIEFRNKYYSYNWNKLDESIIGHIKLIPCKERINELSKDFESMKEMINDDTILSFNDLIKKLEKVECELNKI